MLKDAQRATDDLSVICHAIMAPDRRIESVSPETAAYIARDAATNVIAALTAAAIRGVDVGREVAAVLREHAKNNSVEVV